MVYVFSFSLGFYANMIKEALEKTISEGKVCLSTLTIFFIVILLALNLKANIVN